MVPSGTATISSTPVATVPAAPAVKTSIGADGEEEKTAEDATSVTKVKKVKKKEEESTITVDENDSEERIIEQIEKTAHRKLSPKEKKKAKEVIRTKK
jgi:hypothetical protein